MAVNKDFILGFGAGKAQGGGGVVTDYSSVLMGENQSGLFTFPGITKLRSHLFEDVGGSYSVESTELLEIEQYCFDGSSGLVGLRVPNCTMIGQYALRGTHQETLFAPSVIVAANCANGNKYIKTAVIGGTQSNTGNFQFRNATALKTVDVVGEGRYDNTFNGCTVFDTLILRNQAVIPLYNVGTFVNTCFDSGKTGGDIYIPKSLYDHLGDGTVNDYKAATNWSTINGYGTITWHAIEGSIYENAYADGTPIS